MRISCFIALLFCLALLPFASIYSQEVLVNKSSIIEQYKGKPYFVHFVKQGETLLAISKAYQVSVEEIQVENPSLQKGLQYDMVLRIPKQTVVDNKVNEVNSEKNIPQNSTPSTKASTYTVEKKETLYGISRKFNISVDELLKANPDATHLKEGMVLVIPVVTKSPEVITPKVEKLPEADMNVSEVIVKPGETLYSIAKQYHTSVDSLIILNPELVDGLKSGMLLRLKKSAVSAIPASTPTVNQESVFAPEKPSMSELECYSSENKSKTYNIAMLLPFSLDDVMLENSNETSTAKYSDDCFKYYQLYAGFLLAADSLKKYGLNAKIYVYDADSQNDTLKIKGALRKPEMSKMNLIIGPLYANSFPIAARFARKNAIPIVNPLSKRENLVVDNPYVIKIQPSALAVADKLSAYISSKYANSNVISVSFDTKENSAMINRFYQKLNQLKEEGTFGGTIQKVNFSNDKMAGVLQSLKQDKNNIVIYFTSNKSSVPNFISLLNSQKGNNNVTLIGMEEWNDMELETEFLVNLNFECIAFSNIDYNSHAITSFSQQFRSRYKAKPQVDQNAFLGFDLGWFYLTSLMWYGENFPNCMQYNNYKGLQYNFDFNSYKEGDGKQNATVKILKIVDYKLIEVE